MTAPSFRQIARAMDPVSPPRALSARPSGTPDGEAPRGLAWLHRWREKSPPARLSFRSIVSRHADPRTRRVRLLWLNTELLAASRARPARARELAAVLTTPARPYDIAALCEVLEGVPEVEAEGTVGLDGIEANVLVQSVPELLAHEVRRRRPDAHAASGPEAEGRPFASGLLTFSFGHSITGTARQAFESTGTSPVDNLASKGALLTSVDLGVGVLDVYSAHLASGLTLGGETSDLEETQLAQVDELLNLVRAHRRRNPERVAVVCGDFNIAAEDTPRSQAGSRPARLRNRPYVRMRERMRAAALDDVWPGRGGSLNHTFYNRHDGERVRRICPADPIDGRYCDDRPSDLDLEDSRSGPAFTRAFRRIDYVFLERPSVRHAYRVDYARPRRLPFLRPDGAASRDEHPTSSDHLGLEIELIVSPR